MMMMIMTKAATRTTTAAVIRRRRMIMMMMMMMMMMISPRLSHLRHQSARRVPSTDGGGYRQTSSAVLLETLGGLVGLVSFC